MTLPTHNLSPMAQASPRAKALRRGLVLALGLSVAACSSTQDASRKPGGIDLKPPATTKQTPRPPIDTSRAPSAEAYRLFLEAELRLIESDYTGAADALSEAVVHDPRSVFLKVRHGEVRLRMGDTDRALDQARRALALDNDDAAAWRLLGAAEEQAANLDGAEAAYRQALQRDAADADAAAALAELLVERGDLDDAATVVEAWMEHDVSATDGYRTLAELYAERGDIVRARRYVGLALDRDSLNADALDLARRVHHSIGDHATALRHVRQLIKERGDGPASRYMLLVALRLAGKKAEADALAQGWADDDPSTDMTLLLAEADESTGHVQNALARLSAHPDHDKSLPLSARHARLLFADAQYAASAAAVCPFSDDGTAWGNYLESLCVRSLLYAGRTDDAIARFMDARNRFPESIRLLELGLELEAATGTELGILDAVIQRRTEEKNNTDLLNVHCAALEAQDDKASARRLLQSALDARPHDRELTLSLSRHYERTGDPEAAAALAVRLIERQENTSTSELNFAAFTIADHGLRLGEPLVWARAATLRDPLSGYVVDTLGWVLFRTGQVDEAAKTLRRAMILSPNEPEIMLHLAVVENARDNRAQASVLLERAKQRSAPFPELKKKIAEASKVIWAP